MKFTKSFCLAAGLLFGATFANAGTVTFTCNANVDATVAGTCNTLNTTIAGLYGGTFSNATANIYVMYGTTNLASSTQYYNEETYTSYLAALTANTQKDALDVAAVASLNANATAAYGTDDVNLGSALAATLGFTQRVGGGFADLAGITSGGAVCDIITATSNCYNGLITLSNTPGTWYYRNGVQAGGTYDVYSAIEHETDEVLGTSSCISTTGGSLSDPCPDPVNGTPSQTPSAVDLFRYSSKNNLVLDSSLSTAPGAYFSYDGGNTNGAFGAVYNTLANGNDYADFITGCPSAPRVQDATGCPGDNNIDITNDGGAEINILDAVGYNLAAPEPGTMLLFGGALTAFGLYRRRNRR